MLVFLSCNKDDNQIDETIQPIQNEGYKMVLIKKNVLNTITKRIILKKLNVIKT